MNVHIIERLNLLEQKYEILRMRQQIYELDMGLFINDEISEAEYIEYTKEIKRLEAAVDQLEAMIEGSYKLN